MQTTAAIRPRITARQVAYGALAPLVLVAAIVEAVQHGTGYWQIAAFGIGPDLALIYGIAPNLQKGQLHPRAVPLYNLAHRFWLPIALLVIAVFHLVPLGYLVGALIWTFHISLDRAVGYGLRTRDGLQRA
jgi:hypothetical protein